jgi:hypothetical protein
MILNLKEISKLEAKYRNDHAALTALYNMTDIVSRATEDDLLHPSIAIMTMIDLGILDTNSQQKPVQQHLNS